MWLAKKNPKLSDKALTLLFRSSLHSMRTQLDLPTEEEIITAYTGAVEKLGLAKKLKDGNAQEEHAISLGVVPYTPEQLKKIAQKQKWKPEDIKDKWVVQRDGAAWFLDDNGGS